VIIYKCRGDCGGFFASVAALAAFFASHSWRCALAIMVAANSSRCASISAAMAGAVRI
jgi:hypothetical protein